MNPVTKLSVSSRYYIRNLLQQHSKELKSVVQGADLDANQTSLDQLLESLYPEETELVTKVRQLETLVQRHQVLVMQNLSHSEVLVGTEQRIFKILGFERVAASAILEVKVKIEELVRALNRLSQFSKNFLGATLTASNWRSTRPSLDWLDNFQINRSAEITFSGAITEPASATQLQWVQEWVTAFIQRISQTIRDFATMIEQKKIGELQGGVSLTRVNSHSS